jgi:hypothetical protein
MSKGETQMEVTYQDRITNAGGAGYIGSLLAGELLHHGIIVTDFNDLLFGGDMRDINVSYEKFQPTLGIQASLMPDDGRRDVLHAIPTGLISTRLKSALPNYQYIVQYVPTLYVMSEA